MDGPGRAVALFGDDDLGLAFEVGIVVLVHLFAEDERDEVGVLLDGARLSEIRELRTIISKVPNIEKNRILKQINDLGEGYK